MIRFLLMLIAIASLHADVEDYFKKASGKEGPHQMRNIDFIYMINLDQRPEKFEPCRQMLAAYGIQPYRFSAVNGWELPLEGINELGIKFAYWMLHEIKGTSFLPEDKGEPRHAEPMQVYGRNYFSHCMTRGAIGIVLSHLSILQDAYDSGYETIWVMEDDIEIIQDPHLLSDQIEKLDSLLGKNGWDILFTDRDTKGQDGNYVACLAYAPRPNFQPINPNKFLQREDISPDFRYIGARYGAYSMIVRRSGMKKLLNFFKSHDIFLPFDMDFCLPSDIRFYTVTDDIVSTQPRALSDNGAPNYQKESHGTSP